MRSKLFSLAALIGLLFSVVGCAGTPRETYSKVNDTFIDGLQLLTAAHNDGVFAEKEWAEKVVPLIVKANGFMDAYDAATKANQDGASYIEQLRAVLLELQPYIDTARKKKANDGSVGYRGSADPAGSRGQARDQALRLEGSVGGVHRGAERPAAQARGGVGGERGEVGAGSGVG